MVARSWDANAANNSVTARRDGIIYDTMTPEQQRIKIAEARGWTDAEIVNVNGKIMHGQTEVPDYLNDLNAMHEAEKVLTVAQRITYANQIGVVLSGGSVGRAIPNWWFIHEATASQRAEAFLRTLDKWEETL